LLFIDPTATEVLSRASYDAIGPPLGAWQCWAVVFALVVFVVVARMVVVRLGVAHGSHHEQHHQWADREDEHVCRADPEDERQRQPGDSHHDLDRLAVAVAHGRLPGLHPILSSYSLS
jgi:hypothetical protein